MEFKIPRISNDPLEINLNAGDRLFMVGANGSGKSALIQHLVTSVPKDKTRRIAAHRQTWLHSGSIDITPRGRRKFAQNSRSWEAQDNARWMEQDAQTRQRAVFFDLVAKDNSKARSTRTKLRQVDSKNQNEVSKIVHEVQKSVPLFEQLNKMLALGTLTVSLENSNDEEIFALHGDNGAKFSIAQMSDGERNAALIAAEVLTVEPGTVLLIDEPERHLHRSIIEPFLSALFELREDCAFVVSTHEVALPVANPEARALIVRSCKWNNDRAESWEIELLEANMVLPEDLKRAILGARRRILFVEGTNNSLDQPLYSTLFPDISVVPQKSCVDVQRAVKGLRESHNLHDVEGFGLIDRDDQGDDKIEELAEDGVFALDVYSVEALYYCSDAIEAVASQQAESQGCVTDEMINAAQQIVLDVINENGMAERMAARRCERRVRNLLLSQLPDWKQIKDKQTMNITEEITPLYEEELNRFKELVDGKKLDELLTRYPLRESKVFSEIAKALRFQKRKHYEDAFITRIAKDGVLAQKLKGRISRLSDALDKPKAEPEPALSTVP